MAYGNALALAFIQALSEKSSPRVFYWAMLGHNRAKNIAKLYNCKIFTLKYRFLQCSHIHSTKSNRGTGKALSPMPDICVSKTKCALKTLIIFGFSDFAFVW